MAGHGSGSGSGGSGGRPNLNGTSGDDSIFGSSNNDVIDGNGGDDLIFGGAGDDEIWGGAGNDVIDGGAGNDLIMGDGSGASASGRRGSGSRGSGSGSRGSGSGSHSSHGSASGGDLSFNDYLDGGIGDDVVIGGAGDDTVLGGAGNDILYGDYGPGSGSGSGRGSGSGSRGSGSGRGSASGSGRGSGSGSHGSASGSHGSRGSRGSRGSHGSASGGDLSFNDYLDGGAGNDVLFTQQGDDTGVYTMTENLGATDYYDGGKGYDTIVFNFSLGEFNSSAVQADLAAFTDFLALSSDPTADNGPTYSFEAFDLTVRNWEAFDVIIADGGNGAPTGIALGNDSVDENAAGAVIGALTVTDPDVGDSHALTVDDGRFEVVGNSLQLKAGASLDHETDDGVVVTVTAEDSGGLQTSQSFVLTVNDINEAPTVALANIVTDIDENSDTSGATKLADIVISDDVLGTNNLILSGAHAASFSIVGNELYLNSGVVLDAESLGQLDVTVEVDDAGVGGSPDDSVALSLTVNDINEAPTVALANVVTNIDENSNTSGATKLADIVISDDALGSNGLTLSGAHAASFSIVGLELHLNAGVALDFETLDQLDVTVVVDDAAVGGSPDDSAALSLTVNDINEAPTVALANVVTNIDENSNTSGATKLADIVISDDALGSNNLSLSGAHAASFSIVGNELFLNAGVVLDAESLGQLDVTVAVDDAAVGGSPDDSVALSLTVNDINEAPTVALANVVTNIDENSNTSGSTKLADIVISDDALGSNDLTLSGAHAASFSIVGSELHLNAGVGLDFETLDQLDVTVNVDDSGVGGSPDDSISLSLTVNDINEAPTVALANVVTNIDENSDTSGSTKLADIVISDDALGTNNLTLSGAHAASFSIVGSELFLNAGVVLDTESLGQLDVTVNVDDPGVGGSPDDSVALSLTVNDINEAPTVALANVVTNIDENSDTSGSTKVADIVISDDALGTNNLTLSGAHAASFSIVGSELFLNAGVVLDTETLGQLDVTVDVDDAAVGGSPNDSVSLSLTVNDINEAPTVALANVVTNIDENSDTSGSTKVADIVISDDALGTNNLTLSGADAASFSIVGSELFLNAGVVLDAESLGQLDVTVEVDDPAVGGSPDDSVSLSLAVNDINDAPVMGGDLTAVVDEGNTVVLNAADLGATDVDDGALALTFILDAAPDHGSLWNNGIEVLAGGAFSQADIDAGLISFAHDGSETTSDSFSVSLSDDGGAPAAGGPFTVNLTVNPVNDAPVVTLSPTPALYFQANDGLTGTELWRFDGTTASLVADINTGPGFSSPADLTVFQNKLYFSADDGVNGVELWSYDSGGASQVENLNPYYGSSPSDLTVFDDNLYFGADDGLGGAELWEFNGTTASQVADLNTYYGSFPSDLTVFAGNLYFSADDGVNGAELWQFDGTTASQVVDLNTYYGSSPSDLTVFDGNLYFSADDGTNGAELWKFDGATASQVVDLNSYYGSSPSDLTVFDGNLYFSADDGTNGAELWKYDGTTVSLAADINLGFGSSSPSDLTVFNGSLYFSANDGTNGAELWKFDGTSASQVADLSTSYYGSSPSDLTGFNGNLYFSADDGTNGAELWKFDGSTASLAADINTFYGSSPSEFLVLDIGAVTNEDTPLAIPGFSVTDADAGTDPLRVTLEVANGELSLNNTTELTFSDADGTDGILIFTGTQAEINAAIADFIDYTPCADYHGNDVLVVTLDDLGATGLGGSQSTTVSLDISVSSVNDVPDAVSDVLGTITTEDAPAIIDTADLLADDDDVEGDTLAVTGLGANGLLSATSVKGATVTLNTGTGEIDYDPTGAGVLQALGDGDSVGDSFSYTISDGNGGSDTATVSLTVAGVNDAPVISAPVTANATEDDPTFNVNLLANASDPEGDTLNISNVSLESGDDGGVSLVGGTLSVSPGFYNGLGGEETEEIVYSYDVTDGNGGSTPQTATITIDGVNDPPVVQGDKIFALAAETGAISLQISPPTDVDDTSLTISVTGIPDNAVVRKANGTVVQNGDVLSGSELAGLTIDANNSVGDTTSTFSYTVDDGDTVVPSIVTVRVTDGSYDDTVQDFSIASATVAKITASDAASNDWFGSSVAISGDRMIVGASNDDDAASNGGAAYILERDGAGNWNEIDKLTASDAVADDRLGGSVAIDGDIVIVGARSHDLTPDGHEGAAYVYERNGSGTWVESKLVEPDTDPATVSANFGASVAVSGNTAIVGASGNDELGTSAGAAYVFERDGFGSWSSQELSASSTFGDDFGSAVAISGDFAIVGAEGAASEADSNSGEAYIFERDGNGNWVETSVLFGANLFGSARFGASVAIDGNLAVVGAYGQTILNPSGVGAHPFVGEAYVFERQFNSGTGEFEWNEIAQLAAFDVDRDQDDLFGFSVDISGDTIVVGSMQENVLERFIGDDSGEAYIFQRQGDDWILTEKLLPPVSQYNDNFGNSVAIDGLTIVVGEQSGSTGGLNAAGQIYTFSGALTSETVDLTFVGDDGDDVLVGGAGADVLVGGAGNDRLVGLATPSDSVGQTDEADYQAATGSIDVTFAGLFGGNPLANNEGRVVGDGSVGTDVLIDIDRIVGSDFDDTINVNALYAPQGSMVHQVEGAGGDDTINGNGSTRLGFEHANAGVSADLLSGGASGIASGDAANVGTDTFSGIGSLSGSAFDDEFFGSNGTGLESFRGGAGNDFIDGRGGANDELDYRDSMGGANVDLSGQDGMSGQGTAADGFGTTDTVENMEHVLGSAFDDTLIGDAADNRLEGNSGNDTISGGAGNDDLWGGAGLDQLDGGAGDDTIHGGDGHDYITGGTGNDELYGGDGGEIYVFAKGWDDDVIFDFSAGEGVVDQIDLVDTNVNIFSKVLSRAEDDGNGNVVITVTSVVDEVSITDSITLIGVAEADLHEDDFLLN
jgi:ELWxxDGT repeat protein/VCBS repeat-containing protein